MRKLNIRLVVSTNLEEQDVVDMLIDGFIDRAGGIQDVKVNGKKFEVNDSVFEIRESQGIHAEVPRRKPRKDSRV